MQYAQIEQGIILNVIVCDSPELAAKLGLVAVPDQVGIGWRLDHGNWVEPAPVQTARVITQMAFRRLWLLTERALLDNAMQALPEAVPMQARLLIAALMEDIKATGDNIDPLDADIVQGVALIDLCQIIAAGRAAQIVSALRECSLDDAQTLIDKAKDQLNGLIGGKD